MKILFNKRMSGEAMPCTECGEAVPDEDEVTGDGPVYLREGGEVFCSGECVVWWVRRIGDC